LLRICTRGPPHTCSAKPALEIDRHARRSYGYLGFNSTGAEARGNSALDLVLWDLFGKAVGQPVWQVLGGLSRDRIRIYDTCAGYRYIPGHDIISGILYCEDRGEMPTGLV